MCLAVPRRILRIDGERVEIDWDGEPLVVASGGVPNLAVGDYVLVHAGLVLDRISAEEADQILELYTNLEGADLNVLVGEAPEEARP